MQSKGDWRPIVNTCTNVGSSSLAQAQITGQFIPTNQQSTVVGDLGALPVISISRAPSPGSVVTSGNQSQAVSVKNRYLISHFPPTSIGNTNKNGPDAHTVLA